MTDQQDTNATESNNDAAKAEEQPTPNFMIQKIYVKDLSFEAPNLPELFNVEYKPEVKMEMNSKSRQVADDHFEVILSVTLSATIGEKAAYLAEVHQAGLFLVKDFTDQQAHQLLGAAAPEALYPYVRETIASLIGKTGFPAIQLSPVNFMALYMQSMQQAQAQANQASESSADAASSEATNSETVQ